MKSEYYLINEGSFYGQINLKNGLFGSLLQVEIWYNKSQ